MPPTPTLDTPGMNSKIGRIEHDYGMPAAVNGGAVEPTGGVVSSSPKTFPPDQQPSPNAALEAHSETSAFIVPPSASSVASTSAAQYVKQRLMAANGRNNHQINHRLSPHSLTRLSPPKGATPPSTTTANANGVSHAPPSNGRPLWAPADLLTTNLHKASSSSIASNSSTASSEKTTTTATSKRAVARSAECAEVADLLASELQAELNATNQATAVWSRAQLIQLWTLLRAEKQKDACQFSFFWFLLISYDFDC